MQLILTPSFHKLVVVALLLAGLRGTEAGVKQWVLGKAGASCTATCATLETSNTCNNAAWPKTKEAFFRILDEIDGDCKGEPIVDSTNQNSPYRNTDGGCGFIPNDKRDCDTSHPEYRRFCPCGKGAIGSYK